MKNKQTRKLVWRNKLKKLIRLRLEQISLIVDSYIHNHFTISEKAANHYIEEIASYKNECNVKRTLLTIEKLDWCLKGIAKELQQNPKTSSEPSEAMQHVTRMDIDLTFCEEIELFQKKLKNVEKGNKIESKYIETEDMNVESEPTNLSTEETAKTTTTESHDVSTLHKAISELSIQENSNLNVPDSNLMLNSQSILTFNCEDVENFTCSNIKLVDTDIDDALLKPNANVKLKENIKDSEPNSTIITNELENNLTRADSKIRRSRRQLLNIVNFENNIANVRTTEFTLDSSIEANIIPVVKKKRKPRKLISHAKKNVDKKKNETKKKKASGRDKKEKNIISNNALTTVIDEGHEHNTSCTNNNVIYDNTWEQSNIISEMPIDLSMKSSEPKVKKIVHKKDQETKKKKSTKRKSKVKINNDNKVHTECITQNLSEVTKIDTFKNKDQTNKSLEFTSILTKNDINQSDLTWIENIKYVREISDEEIILANFDHNFWTDCTFPKDFEDEFE